MLKTLRSLALSVLCGLLITAGMAGAEEPPERAVLVTVDDLPITPTRLHPDPEDRRRITEQLLATLKRHDIRAVGLVTWQNVRDEADRELLDLWLEAGHELGNHSNRHLSYTRTDFETYREDVETARRALADFLGERDHTLRFFRFPQLHEGDTPEKLAAMRQYLHETAQRNLPVTLDNADWSFEEPWVQAVRNGDEKEMARVTEAFHDSLRLSIRHHERRSETLFGRTVPQILLLHANSVGAAQWDRLFTWFKDRGYRFADVDEVLSDPVFQEPHEHVGPRGFGLWDRLGLAREMRKVRREVVQLLGDQMAAWNRADLEAFTAFYAEDCAFVSTSGLSQGRQQVLDRYRHRYGDGDPAVMGTLGFELLGIDPVWGVETSMVGDSRPSSVHGVSVVARWRLSYPEGSERRNAEGLTLLVLHRTADGWEIVQDASM